MKGRYKMPRPRKYDYKVDLPVTLFVKIPVKLHRDLEQLNLSSSSLDKIITDYLTEYTKKHTKES